MIDIAILTPIELEYTYLVSLLKDREHVSATSPYRYERGHIPNSKQPLSAVITLSGSKTVDIALATNRIIDQFNPSIVLLAGIAGGVKDVNIGDIVIGTKAYGYESGKETEETFLVRPEVLPYDRDLIEFARLVAREDRWRNPRQATSNTKVFFGPIASGDKLIASSNGSVNQLLKNSYNDTTALEMEAIGFAKAVTGFRDVRAMNIRGISDLLGNKALTDQQGGQHVALENLTTFLMDLLYKIDIKEFNNGRTISQSAVKNDSSTPKRSDGSISNAITGGNVTANGNIYIGNISTSQQSHPGSARSTNGVSSSSILSSQEANRLRQMIGNTRLAEVLNELEILTANNENFCNEIIQVKNRRSNLKRQERMNVISYEDLSVQMAKVTNSTLQLITELTSNTH